MLGQNPAGNVVRVEWESLQQWRVDRLDWSQSVLGTGLSEGKNTGEGGARRGGEEQI